MEPIMYATATELLNRYGAEEIAQRADPVRSGLVYGDLLRKAAAGDDLSDYSPEEQEAAAAALAKVERALQDASHTINGYIGSRYQLPLSRVPDVLKMHGCQIARFMLYDDDATKQVETLYQGSLKFLRDVSSGAADLGLTATGGTPPPAAGAEMVSGGNLVFGRKNSGGFI
jgi:phage gp36-like protein